MSIYFPSGVFLGNPRWKTSLTLGSYIDNETPKTVDWLKIAAKPTAGSFIPYIQAKSSISLKSLYSLEIDRESAKLVIKYQRKYITMQQINV